ncbi:MFS transporter [Streptomyces sp. NPDC004111]|uniref:MFS transporter n=1 Tax=Streptomyces sp. NPDC004111 TaxID=3364690 RepID=UPI0036C378A0
MNRALASLTPRVITSFVGTSVVAFLAANLVPVLIGGLVADLGMSVTGAGAVATGMSLGTALALFAANRYVTRGDRPRIARYGLATMTAGFGIAALFPQQAVVAGGIVVGGMGCGIVVAAGTAASAATVDPDRTTSTVVVVNRVMAALLLAVVPLLGDGLRTVLLVLAGAGITGFCFAGALPNLPAQPPTEDTEGSGEQAGLAGKPLVPGGERFGTLAIVLALVFGAWSLTEDMVYSMAGNIATGQVGLTADTSSQLLSLKIVGGLLGALLAPVALKRIGRSWSILVILAVSTVCKFLIATASGPAVYGTALTVWGVLYGAILALVFGLAARMALSGRVGLLVQSVYIIGIAFAPVVGGALFSRAAPVVFGLTVAVPSVVTGVILLLVSRRSGVSEHGGAIDEAGGRGEAGGVAEGAPRNAEADPGPTHDTKAEARPAAASATPAPEPTRTPAAPTPGVQTTPLPK